MAADNYYESGADNPYTTDTSNAGDWWTQNQPPPSAPITGAPWAPDTPQANGETPQFISNQPTIPVQSPSGTPWGAAGPYINWDTSGNQFSWGSPQGAPGPQSGGSAASWGGPVEPFQGMPYPTFTPPPLPDYLQKGFQLPSAEELESSPGYMARYQQGLTSRDRSAAAHGTILNGGTQKALARYGQDYASNEYGNLVNQRLGERQQQSSDYLNLAYGPAWQQNSAAVNQYGQLYKQYQDQIGNNRNSMSDYWSQQMDLLNASLKAASAGSPGSTGGQG